MNICNEVNYKGFFHVTSEIQRSSLPCCSNILHVCKCESKLWEIFNYKHKKAKKEVEYQKMQKEETDDNFFYPAQ